MSPSKSTLSPRKTQLWDKSNMILAVKAVMEEDWTFNNASSKYCIPRTTLHERITKLRSGHEVDLGYTTPGRKPALSEQDENTIVEYAMVEMQGLFNIPKLRTAICELAEKLAAKNGDRDESQKNEFASSKSWFRRFVERHPNLSVLRPAAVPAAPEPEFKIPGPRPSTRSSSSTSESYYNNIPKVVNQTNLEAKEEANTPKPSNLNESKRFRQTNFAANQRAKKQANALKPSNFAKSGKSEPFVTNHPVREATVPKKSSKSSEPADISEKVRCSMVSYDPDGGKWVRSFTCDSCEVRTCEDYYNLDEMSDKYLCKSCSD
ncbi:uncharacterized protein LOC135835606 [Planococcus citri]|uniref:uncharacterized protein LOC135835606 n=1 Tax=Planococcus citri TaxID=170843 RepID=UPI0031F91F67